ncbi:MAG: hypothetical protein K6F87_02460 [Lachnospiraceae bacterium]|nr:hypothetical protein [Lachnospiraceae bacterium]
MSISGKETKRLSGIVGRVITAAAIITMILSVVISIFALAQREYDDAKELLMLSAEDIRGELRDDLQDFSDEKLIEKLKDMVRHRHFGQTGSILICNRQKHRYRMSRISSLRDFRKHPTWELLPYRITL